MKKIELLAPAGNMESLVAAVMGGCDAVYLGGYMFGARNYAGNFSDEQMIEAIKYAHMYGVKVYVTGNTIIYEDEVTMFINYIDFLHQNNVDAVIIQDIGMMDLVRQTYPNLAVHASTQMHIHNLEGVRLVQKMGLKRVVLARETNIETISEIKKEASMELEIFVHGALCISYSGQCLMSSLVGGRSGNRGTCAQSCRQKYDLIIDGKKVNEDEYLLSTKDLSTLENIGELIEAGVDSIKIEGRMKRAEYVYLVVSLYRKAIDSYSQNKKVAITKEDINDLKKIFNRDFTKGFLFNENNKNMVNQFRPNHLGIEIGQVVLSKNGKVKIKLSNCVNIGDGIRIIGKTDDMGCLVTKMDLNGKLVNQAKENDIIEIRVKEDVEVNSRVLKTSDSMQLEEINELIKLKTRKVLITGTVDIKDSAPIKLQLSDGVNTVVTVSDDLVVAARNSPLTIENVEKQIKKLGGTPYEFSELTINIDSNVFVDIKLLNEIRRQAVSLLDEKRLYQIKYLKNVYKRDVKNYDAEQKINVLISNKKQYDRIKDNKIDEIYVDTENLYDELKEDNRVILKLPRVINRYKEYNQPLLVGELGSINKYSDVDTDFSLNVTNSYSVAFLHGMGVKKVTLSYELDDRKTKEIINSYQKRYNAHPNLELIIYGSEEAMITKFNLLDYYKVNGTQSYLKDRFDNLYPIKIQEDLMYIYNYKPRRAKDIAKYYEMGINNLRLNLLAEETMPELKYFF